MAAAATGDEAGAAVELELADDEPLDAGLEAALELVGLAMVGLELEAEAVGYW